jgi:hypothetical protein
MLNKEKERILKSDEKSITYSIGALSCVASFRVL